MEFQEREKNIMAFVAVLAAIGIYFYVAKPAIEQNKNMQYEITRLEKELIDPETIKQDVEKIENIITILNKEIETVKQQIPKSEKRGFLIRDIESLAHANNIEVISFLPKEATAVTLGGQEITEKLKRMLRRKNKNISQGEILKTVISIDSTGLFPDYNKFFADIITYYRAVELADLTVSKVGIAQRGIDKRFSKKRKGKSLLDEYENVTLNVAFTLYAYTALEN